jgi:murein L,D-transpeptidase YafK
LDARDRLLASTVRAGLLLLIISLTAGARAAPLRKLGTWEGDDKDSGPTRARKARDNKLTEVKQLFAAAKVAFPPRQLLLRAFKREKELEVWASAGEGQALAHIATYEICRMSGSLGPKKKEGDWQVPEGFYAIDHYKDKSDYYLALRVSYPNRRDRQLRFAGSAIMIHGRCVSIGCLAMTDERIQELWVMATAVRALGKVVHVHLYPARDLAKLIASTSDAELKSFWGNLKEGLDRFDRQHKLLNVTVDKQGRYLFR